MHAHACTRTYVHIAGGGISLNNSWKGILQPGIGNLFHLITHDLQEQHYPPVQSTSFKFLFYFIFKLSYKIVGFHMTLSYIISLVNPLPTSSCPPPHFLSSFLASTDTVFYDCTHKEILNKF